MIALWPDVVLSSSVAAGFRLDRRIDLSALLPLCQMQRLQYIRREFVDKEAQGCAADRSAVGGSRIVEVPVTLRVIRFGEPTRCRIA